MNKPKRIIDLITKKQNNEKITMLTAYDFPIASIIDECDIDILFVGDSLGMTFAGHDSTIPVTLDDIVYHTKVVARANKKSLLLADLPFGSYQLSLEQAKANAARLVQEAGAHAVKFESHHNDHETAAAITGMGIPVVGHIGLTPQSVHQLSGYRLQGATKEDAKRLLDQAKALEAAGCFAIVLEKVPADLAKSISQAIAIPTIGIGAGPHCDGQVLVTNDLLGLGGFYPKFVKQYANLTRNIKKAVNTFKKEVDAGTFPDQNHTY